MSARIDGFRVFMRGLRLEAEIGVHPHERGRAQPLTVDVEVALSPREVAHIGDTVNYELLRDYARALAARGHVELVETYAQDLARAVLRETGGLEVTVRVEKPEALDGAQAAGVEVRLVRKG